MIYSLAVFRKVGNTGKIYQYKLLINERVMENVKSKSLLRNALSID